MAALLIHTHDDIISGVCFALQLKTVLNPKIIKRGTKSKKMVFAFSKKFLIDVFFDDFCMIQKFSIQCSCNFYNNPGIQTLHSKSIWRIANVLI